MKLGNVNYKNQLTMHCLKMNFFRTCCKLKDFGKSKLRTMFNVSFKATNYYFCVKSMPKTLSTYFNFQLAKLSKTITYTTMRQNACLKQCRHKSDKWIDELEIGYWLSLVTHDLLQQNKDLTLTAEQ